MATTPEKTPMQLEADRRADAMRNEQAPGATEVHTYADGSQRVGVPPFPAKSPLEEIQEQKRQMANGDFVQPMVVPQGMKTSGEAPASPASGITESAFIEKAEQQLSSDVMSGKSPEVVNPTTASTKPELAGTDGHVGETGVIGDNPTAEDLEKLAAQIKPEGDFDVTDDQKAAAVAQVARETGMPVTKDEKPTKASKSAKK